MTENHDKAGYARHPVQPGVILGSLTRLVSHIYEAAKKSFLSMLLCSYFTLCRLYEDTFLYHLLKKVNLRERVIFPVRKVVSRAFERSGLLRMTEKKATDFLSYPVRNIGVFLLSCGIYSAIVYFVREYIIQGMHADLMTLYTGGVLVLLSVFLLLSKRSVASAVCGSTILSYIVFEVIGKPRHKVTPCEAVQKSVSTPLLLGIVFGLLSFFVSPVSILAVILVLFAVYEIMTAPEFGILLTVFFLPFFSTLYIAALLFVTLVSYTIKLLRGKRSLRLRLLDFFVLIFGALIIFGGAVSVSPASRNEAALMLMFLLAGYFLFANLIRSADLMKKVFSVICASSFIVSVVGIIEYVFGNPSTKWQDNQMFSEISGRIVSTFNNPNVLSVYLLLAVPFSVFALLTSQAKSHKFRYFILTAAGIGAMILTWSRGAWLAILISFFISFLLYSRKFLSGVIVCAAPCALGVTFLPQNMIDRFLSIGNIADSSTSYRLSVWKSTLQMLRHHFWSGVGIGGEAYNLSYLQYALPGIEAAPHSHSLYLQIWSEMGIFGLLVFLAVVFFFIQMIFSCAVQNGAGTLKKYLFAPFCAVLGVLIQGFTDYSFYNYKMFLFFFIVAGIGAAVVNCIRESEIPGDWSQL